MIRDVSEERNEGDYYTAWSTHERLAKMRSRVTLVSQVSLSAARMMSHAYTSVTSLLGPLSQRHAGLEQFF
jgi:hypothetical protein